MKINLNVIFFFFLIISVRPAVAQIVVDAGHIDIIHLESPWGSSLLVRDKELYDRVSTKFDPDGDNDNYRWTVEPWESYDSLSSLSGEELVDVDKDMELLTPQQFEKMLENKKFTFYEDSVTRKELIKLNKYFFIIFEYRKEEVADGKYKWKMDYEVLTNYYYMKVGDKYTIALVSGNRFEGNIIPLLNNKLRIKIDNEKDVILKQREGKTVTKKEREEFIKYFDSDHFEYEVRETDDGQTLWLKEMGYQALPIVYDSIEIYNKNIIARKDNKYTVFNPFLDTLVMNNIQVARTFHHYLEIIKDNKHIWMDGKKTVKKIRIYTEGDDLISPDLLPTEYSFIKISDKIYLNRKRFDIFSSYTYKQDNLIFVGNDVNSIYFSNKEAVKIAANPFIDSNYVNFTYGERFEDYSDCRNLKDEYLIVEKDNKYGMASININSYDNGFTLTNLLPAKFDKIDNTRFTLGLERYIFYKDNLIGIYPCMTETRYKALGEKAGNFIRFTLPSGEEGWLCVADGKEYLDIKK